MNKESLTPFVATHPGEMIKDELKERNMTQKQLAAESGIKASVLSETINGKRSVSLNVAVALEKVLGVPADVWMNMQTQYDLDTANIADRGNKKETVEVIIPVHDRNLLKGMYNYLNTHGDLFYIKYKNRLCGDVCLQPSGEVNIVIAKPFQNKHIGRRAMAGIIQLAREKGISQLHAEIYAFNTQSQKMFLSVGFIQKGNEQYTLCL